MRPRRFPALIAVLMVASTVTARAASFDCVKAASPIEKMICEDPTLSMADGHLAEAFKAALAASPDPAQLHADERKWLAERDKITDVEELRHAYRKRIDILEEDTEKWRSAKNDPGQARAEAAIGAKSTIEICGKSVEYEVDEETFTQGPPADDPVALKTARLRAPNLIHDGFEALCAKNTLSAEEISAKVRRVTISWAGGADEFSADFPKEEEGTLATEFTWQGSEAPSAEDVRDGILCAFRPALKMCADQEP